MWAATAWPCAGRVFFSPALPPGAPPALPHFFCRDTSLYDSIKDLSGGSDDLVETDHRPTEEKSWIQGNCFMPGKSQTP